MATSGGLICVKKILFVFNLVFFFVGLGLIIVGCLIQTKYSDYLAFFDSKVNVAAVIVISVGSVLFIVAAVIVISVGSVLFIVGFFGCCGAHKENICMLTAFSILVGVVFLVEISSAVAGHVMRSELDTLIRTTMSEATRSYNRYGVREAWDETQFHLQCCGANNYSDWMNGTSLSAIPWSCCINVTSMSASESSKVISCGNTASNIHKQGCASKLLSWTEDNIIVLAGIALALAFVQAMAIGLGLFLTRAIKKACRVPPIE